MKPTIYTAIYGGYDTLKAQPKQKHMDCEFVCYTDNPHLKQEPHPTLPPEEVATWVIKHKPETILGKYSSMLSAKYWKLNSYLVNPNAATVWIDGTARIRTSDFLHAICCRMNPDGEGLSDALLFPHPFRHCIHEEAFHCKDFQKYLGTPIVEQSQSYLNRGIGFQEGLWACGVIARRATADVVDFNQKWWDEITKWTHQDQISFPYAARMTGLKFRTWVGENIFSNPYVVCDLNHDGPNGDRYK